MKSASIIRTFSRIIMVITIITSLIVGYKVYDDNGEPGIMLLIWIVGISFSVFNTALFVGFADLIDNTYLTAYSLKNHDLPNYLKPENTFSQNNSAADIKNTVDTDRQKKAQDLLAKGLINQSEYDEMTMSDNK